MTVIDPARYTYARPAIAVAGFPWQIRFPALCPNCGQPATTPLTIYVTATKQVQARPRVRHHQTVSYHVPFCDGCVAQHQTEVEPISDGQRLRRLLEAAIFVVPGLIAASLALYFLFAILRYLVKGDVGALIFFIPVTLFFLGMAAWFFYSAQLRTLHLIAPPPTSITSAVSVSDNRGKLFDPPWREFRFRHVSYPQPFADRNRALLWNPTGLWARTGQLLRVVLLVILVLTIATTALWYLSSRASL